MAVDVYITETRWVYGQWLYAIIVDGQQYDSFFSKTSLTWSQQADVVAGYREGLDG